MNDLNPDARRLVDLARAARSPGPQDKLRVARRLAVPLATGAAAGTTASAAKAASTLLGSWTAKVVAALVVSAAGTALVVGQLEREAGPATVASRAVAAQQVWPAPPAPAAEPARERAPAEASAKVTTARAAPRVAAASASKPADELAQEAALLHQAQSAWRAGQSEQALQLANRHAQRYPRSQLANERDVLRVLSLCRLGRVQTARQVGARLLRQAKGSPWYQSIAGSCAAE